MDVFPLIGNSLGLSRALIWIEEPEDRRYGREED